MNKTIIPLLALLLALILALSGCSAAIKGNMALTRHDYQESILQYQEALKANPGNVLSQSRLGQAYYRSGQYAEAVKTLEALLVTPTDDPEAPIFLGLSYLAQGDRDKGFASFERFRSFIWRERRNVLEQTALFRQMPQLNLDEVEAKLFQAIADGFREQDEISHQSD